MIDQEIAKWIRNNILIDRAFLKWAVGVYMRTNWNEPDCPECENYISVDRMKKILLQIVEDVDVDMANEGGF